MLATPADDMCTHWSGFRAQASHVGRSKIALDIKQKDRAVMWPRSEVGSDQALGRCISKSVMESVVSSRDWAR